MRYEDFSLLISPPHDKVYPILVQSPAGEGRGELRLPFEPSSLPPLPEVPSISGHAEKPSEPSPEVLSSEEAGGRLFQALFSGQVRDLFERSLGRIEGDPESGLRIALHFDPDLPGTSRFASLPWERLYRRDQRQYLNFSRKSPIVRSLNVPRSLPPKLSPPLRVLIVVASPSDRMALDAEVEVAALQQALHPLSGVHNTVLPHATPEALREELLKATYHVLHFIGHGSFNPENGEGSLLFEGADGRARPVQGPLLADMLRDFSSLRLVFLNACRTAESSETFDPFAGLATALVMAGVPAVLGMQLTVSDEAAIAFSSAFYRRLAAGDPIDAATVEGRMAIHLEDIRSQEWATPVLFLRASDGRLFDPPPTLAEPGISPEIRAAITHNERFIADKTAGFIGRGWLFDSVERFLHEKPRGYFLLRGDPGIGKSAFIAQMVRRGGYPHHFNIRAEGVRSPETFLANICSQIIATYGLEHTDLPPEATRDSRFLNGLLEKVSTRLDPNGRAVILVDALDESDRTTLSAGANTLYLPTILPPGVFFVVTTRREAQPLRIDCELQTLDIEQDSEGNLADVREYVASKLPLTGIRTYIVDQGLNDGSFVEHLVEKSQGNFIYLRYVLPEIEGGAYKDRELGDLPVGLQNYYQDHWLRMSTRDLDDWRKNQLPVIVALTIVKEPISIESIQRFSGVDERWRIRKVLSEWEPLLYTASAQANQDQVEKRYRLYHASFQDFVAAKDEVADGRADRKDRIDEGVDLRKAHAKIGDVLVKKKYG